MPRYPNRVLEQSGSFVATTGSCTGNRADPDADTDLEDSAGRRGTRGTDDQPQPLRENAFASPSLALLSLTTNHMSNRFQRPEDPEPLALTSRDREILRSVYNHRLVTAEHLRALIFNGCSRRTTQARLRKLWVAKLLDRRFVTIIAAHGEIRGSPVPLYCLGQVGRGVVRELLDAPIETGRPNPLRFAGPQSESELRRKLAAWLRARGSNLNGALVSDGAFGLEREGQKERWTFHVEVIRAGAPGGNKSVAKKLARYAELNRSGFFGQAFDHRVVRAVLIATTSKARSETFRALAAKLPGSRRLFWFGSFRSEVIGGVPVSSLLTAGSSPIWTDAEGSTFSIVPTPNQQTFDHKPV
ncbi:MAG: replication-relaxation family protein [Deltaproteobacteria bacterium]|nr:replication-relaxation family protein [Deltaproteobacteria bacterium]